MYADLDASKATRIGAVIYHVKGNDPEIQAYPNRSDIEPILFLSRLISPAESRYWPTELEIAGLVWVIRKIRYMIESSQHPVRIYTDHGASPVISLQTTLHTTSTERSNLRLVRASEYIQRFNLDIRHKPEKANTIPDALSRLANTAPPTNEVELDFTNVSHVSAYNYMATLVEMKPEFKQTILDGYTKDVSYYRITDILDSNRARNLEDRNDLPFEKDQEGLIWHLRETRRLCIPNTAKLIGELLEIAHTKHGHPGGDRTFKRASSSWYIRGLLKHI